MSKERVYPIIIRMKSKDVQIGSVKIEFISRRIISNVYQVHDAILKQIKLNFKEGDWITNVTSNWR